MKQERYDNYKDEYKELCEIFGCSPKIDVDKLYDCEVRIEGEIEKLLKHQNKKLYKQAKAELEAEGVLFKVDKIKREFILNQFKDFLFDCRIFPKVEDYKTVLQFNKHSQIQDYVQDLQKKFLKQSNKVEEDWSYDL